MLQFNWQYHSICQCLGWWEQPAKLILPSLLLALSGPASQFYLWTYGTCGPSFILLVHFFWDQILRINIFSGGAPSAEHNPASRLRPRHPQLESSFKGPLSFKAKVRLAEKVFYLTKTIELINPCQTSSIKIRKIQNNCRRAADFYLAKICGGIVAVFVVCNLPRLAIGGFEVWR